MDHVLLIALIINIKLIFQHVVTVVLIVLALVVLQVVVQTAYHVKIRMLIF